MSDRLPVLGEPFAVELANTDHRNGHERRDFLADPAALATWFGHAPNAAGLVLPTPLSPVVAADVSRIRDATRLLLGESVDGNRTSNRAGAAEVLHHHARRAAGYLALDVDGADTPTWQLHHEGHDHDAFLAAVASRCILFLGGADADRVRRCARPDCPMFFVQRHRARRFCDDTCAHSVRQSRYYRRHNRDQSGPRAVSGACS